MKLSIRNIIIERLYLILESSVDKTNLKECGEIFHPNLDNQADIVWSIRLYVLVAECFQEWTKDNPIKKYQDLSKSIMKFPKSVYFQQITTKSIDHKSIDEYMKTLLNSNSDLKDTDSKSSKLNQDKR